MWIEGSWQNGSGVQNEKNKRDIKYDTEKKAWIFLAPGLGYGFKFIWRCAFWQVIFWLLALLFLSQKVILSDKLKNSIILRLQCLLHFEFTINKSYTVACFFWWSIVNNARVFKNSQLPLMDIINHELLQNSKDTCDLITIILLFFILVPYFFNSKTFLLIFSKYCFSA